MIKLFFLFLLSSSIYSCSSNKKIFKEPLQNNGQLHGTFNNRLAGYDSLNYKRINANVNLNEVTLQSLFGIRSLFVSDTIYFKLIDKQQLEIKYRDSAMDKTMIVNRKLSRKGYFQYFVKRKVIQVPPVISFIYGSRLIDRLRIGINLSGNLVVENKYVSEGNILIFGNGAAYKQLYYFTVK
jgi:hypothetical protein